MTKYLYHATDGREIWLAFDPEFPCIYCGEPVAHLSFGGPAVCCSCDCGKKRTGERWSYGEVNDLFANARARLDEIADRQQAAG